METITATFEITGWDETTYDEPAEGPKLARATVRVIQHGGIGDETDQLAFGRIVPGSGTGALAGLRGEATFAHDDQGARLTLSFTR